MLTPTVSRCHIDRIDALTTLLTGYQLQVKVVAENESIDGSYWGEPEAGLVSNKLIIRTDTPIHSALHEACHYVCMDSERRNRLHTDAAGGYDEEDAVCYLQILLADQLADYDREQMFADMDSWGYSFRLGSSRAWFDQDAEDAREWLMKYKLIDDTQRPTWALRG